MHAQPTNSQSGKEFRQWASLQIEQGAAAKYYWQKYWSSLGQSGRLRPIDQDWPNFAKLLEWADKKKEDLLFLDLMMLLVHYMDRRGKYKERLEYASKAIHASERLQTKVGPEFRLVRALLHIDALGFPLIERGDLNEAKEEISVGLRIAEDAHLEELTSEIAVNLKALAHAFLTIAYLQEDALAQADAEIGKALAVKEKCGPEVKHRILTAAGELRHHQQKYTAAINLYKEAIQNATANEADRNQVIHRLAGVYFDQGDLEKAEDLINKYLAGTPPTTTGEAAELARAYLQAAKIALRQNDIKKSHLRGEEALNLLSNFRPDHNVLRDEIQEFLASIS